MPQESPGGLHFCRSPTPSLWKLFPIFQALKRWSVCQCGREDSDNGQTLSSENIASIGLTRDKQLIYKHVNISCLG